MFVYSLLDITMTSLNDLENLIVEKDATKIKWIDSKPS